jgi:hypothetical protein
MSPFRKPLFAAAAVATLLSGQAQAADVAYEDTSGWTFTGAAYLWGAGIAGDVGVFGDGVLNLQPQEVDISFTDILENLEFAFMGLGEARNGRFVMGMDLTYTKVGVTVENPLDGPLDLESIDANTTAWMVTGFGGYSIVDGEDVRVDLIAGARYWSVDNDFELNGGKLDERSFSDGADWIDPLAGVKMRFSLSDDIYVASWGMIGGFGVGSDLMWDVMAGAGYSFTEHFDVFAGYRAVSVDYSDDSFVYDIVQQGPVVAGVFRF